MSEPPNPGLHIPERGLTNADEVLDLLLGWLSQRGLTLYPAQEEAILQLYGGAHVVLETPTGSGKSLVATALMLQELCRAERSVYTAPIKALVSEKFFELCGVFGAEAVGLVTGDGSVNRDAPILCCTAEVLSNMALSQAEDTPYASVIMDEFHYYGDRDRGAAWQIPLLRMTRARFLLMSATLGDMGAIIEDLRARTGREVAHVRSASRPVPLSYEYAERPLQSTVLKLVREGWSPLYVVHFTQRQAGETAGALMSVPLIDDEGKRRVKAALKGFRFDSPYGPDLQRTLLHGVGVHHAGLLPKYRLLVEKLAQGGLLKVICGTDTLGVGINVPIRSVLFTQLCKFDGEKVDLLSARDFHQIAGRAGRKGFDDAGLVVAQAPDWVIENQKRLTEARSGQGHKKRPTLKGPPPKGYRHWTREVFENLVARPPEPLVSRLRVDHGMLLALLQRAEARGGDGLEDLCQLIEQSHATARERQEMRAQAQRLLDELVHAGVATRDADGVHGVSGALQQDFSLHHALSLFLLHAIERLDRQHPEFAFQVLTLVESILEHPRVVLHAQVDLAKRALLAELKAQGVPFEERQELLEEVSWPKPMADWIYATFNAYREDHPWVSADHILPKAVARPMAERFASFSEVVRELGIGRAEGVLLRYLSQVWRALSTNVPREHHTPELEDLIAWLRATVARVDASLVTEWERLLAGEAPEGAVAPAPVDISRDARAFTARVRAELHAVVRAMSLGDWAEAASGLRQRDQGPEERPTWTAEALEAAMAPYLESYGRVRFDGEARMAWNTRLSPQGPRLWQVQQLLVDDEGDNAWSLDGVIDLTDDTNPEGPLVELLRVGV